MSPVVRCHVKVADSGYISDRCVQIGADGQVLLVAGELGTCRDITADGNASIRGRDADITCHSLVHRYISDNTQAVCHYNGELTPTASFMTTTVPPSSSVAVFFNRGQKSIGEADFP